MPTLLTRQSRRPNRESVVSKKPSSSEVLRASTTACIAASGTKIFNSFARASPGSHGRPQNATRPPSWTNVRTMPSPTAGVGRIEHRSNDYHSEVQVGSRSHFLASPQ